MKLRSPLHAEVTGVLRLTIRATLIAGGDDLRSEDAVLGDLRLVGGADAMARLSEEP